jgi:hypothetical protein
MLNVEVEKSRMWRYTPKTKKSYLKDAVDASVDIGIHSSYNDEIVPIANYSSIASSFDLTFNKSKFLSIGKLMWTIPP